MGLELVFLLPNFLAFFAALFLPGYFLALAFFPQKKAFTKPERAVLSFVFSIVFVPMLVLIENVIFAIPVDFVAVLSTTVFTAIIAFWVFLARTQQIGAPEFVFKFFPKIKKEDAVNVFSKKFLGD